MRRIAVRLILIAVVLVTAVAASFGPVASYWRGRNRPQYRTTDVSRGGIVYVINSTGTVKPVLTVQVGSFVSGPIKEIFVDFNDHVKKDAMMATIDPMIYDSNLLRDKAVLATRVADVERVEAQLQLARRDEGRSIALRTENVDFISQAEMDQFKFNRMSLVAQLAVAKATVDQAQGSLEYSEAQVGYTRIKSPVEGIVIDRKIQPGQTIAASFQTPELFIIAPDMEKKMHVFAAVDEADVGQVRKAMEEKRPVHFMVDAYPNDLFEGHIEQVRMSSTTTQSVVTYPVIVAASNLELKLMPGMTASLSFQIDEKQDILRVPNAALRFYPDIKQVRPEDQKLLDGSEEATASPAGERKLSALEKAAAAKTRNRRHVWVVENGLLKAVEVVTGIGDSKYSEIVSGDLTEGQALVTGIQPVKTN